MRTCDPTRPICASTSPSPRSATQSAGTGLNTPPPSQRPRRAAALDSRAGRGAQQADRHPADRGSAAGERSRVRPLGRRRDLHLPLADPAAVLAGAGPAALRGPAAAGHRLRGGPGGPGAPRLCLLAGPGVVAAGVHPVLHLGGAARMVRAVRPGGAMARAGRGGRGRRPGPGHRRGDPDADLRHGHVAGPAADRPGPQCPAADQRRRLNEPARRGGRPGWAGFRRPGWAGFRRARWAGFRRAGRPGYWCARWLGAE